MFERADELTEAGLDLPVAGDVAERLRKDGVSIKAGITEADELIEALCQLKSRI